MNSPWTAQKHWKLLEKQSLSNLNPQRQIRLKMGPVKPHEKMILIVYPDPEYRDRKRLREQFEVSIPKPRLLNWIIY